MQFRLHNGRISTFPFTGGITWRGRRRLYLSALQMRLSHTLKMIYGMGKTGIQREAEKSHRRRQVGVCLGNEKEVRNEVALIDRCVKCVWRKNEVRKIYGY